jgi:hypothetical protein
LFRFQRFDFLEQFLPGRVSEAVACAGRVDQPWTIVIADHQSVKILIRWSISTDYKFLPFIDAYLLPSSRSEGRVRICYPVAWRPALQVPGSRLIAAEKANTANALSGPNFAFSTANLFTPAQRGQSLYSPATSAPPNAQVIFAGSPDALGRSNDPMVGKPIGGIVVFGGGLALYDSKGKIIGGLGVSGDTSCVDHVIAWKLRHSLGFDHVPYGVAPGQNDNIILDIQNGISASGFGHPSCQGGKPPDEIIKHLPEAVKFA